MKSREPAHSQALSQRKIDRQESESRDPGRQLCRWLKRIDNDDDNDNNTDRETNTGVSKMFRDWRTSFCILFQFATGISLHSNAHVVVVVSIVVCIANCIGDYVEGNYVFAFVPMYHLRHNGNGWFF